MKSENRGLKINELREKDRLDSARYSISFKSLKDLDREKEFVHDIIKKLGAGHDAILEFNSMFLSTKIKFSANKNTIRYYLDELARLGISTVYRKIPQVGGESIFERMFSFGKPKEIEEIFAYIDNEMLCSEEFRQILPFDGIRLYTAKKSSLMGDCDNCREAINNFLNKTDEEKISLIELSVFCYMFFGQIGISTIKVDLAELKEILGQ